MQDFLNVRRTSLALCEGLSAEDMTAQAMPDASPTKWHLAHTTWFFERFILQESCKDYRPFHPKYDHLFNSYYETIGQPFLRPKRGLLTRPHLSEVLAYRNHVDEAMARLLDAEPQTHKALLEVGLHHEMQHQELLLTDILALLAENPLLPAIKTPAEDCGHCHQPLQFIEFEGQFAQIGAPAEGFAYDCERPAHQVWLHPFALANRLVSNAEWLAFMSDGGYHNPALWLADGWSQVKQAQWQAPLYWQELDGHWHQYGLDGLQPLNLAAPVCHVSYYEADAFARWAGKRLPKEHELELASPDAAEAGTNFLEARRWRPAQACGTGLLQLYGDVWEWSQSAFLPYPKFQPEAGALAEYNGKFMVNQFVLRGGSCVTPRMQMRRSYRNFFYPHQRWQFTGVRLADDI